MYNNNGYNNQGYGQGYNQGSGRGGGLFGANPISMVAKGVASGIGLASESIHSHKEKKAAKKAAEADEARHSPSQSPAQGAGHAGPMSHPQGSREPLEKGAPQSPREQADYGTPQVSRQFSGQETHQSPPPQADYGAPPAYGEDEQHQLRPEKQRTHSSKEGAPEGDRELEEGDEEQWDLDDAQDKVVEHHEQIGPKVRKFEKDPKTTTQNFINDYPLPEGYHPHGRLTLPVVIPQRRPKDRTRGFIRAYAPELMNNDIDETMFIDFIQTFELASTASPWINAINLAGLALLPLHLAPGIGQAATVALYLTVSVLKNMDGRKRYAL